VHFVKGSYEATAAESKQEEAAYKPSKNSKWANFPVYCLFSPNRKE